MNQYIKCPFCEKETGVKNGKTKPDKYGRRKQKYLCKNCGKQFSSKQKPLNKTEKRLFSLLYNLIRYDANENDTLKTITEACNKEVNSIGKLNLTVTGEDIDLNSLDDIKIIVCANDNDIKIIKTYPKSINIEFFVGKMRTFFDKYN